MKSKFIFTFRANFVAVFLLTSSLFFVSCVTERTGGSDNTKSEAPDTPAEIAEYEAFNNLTKQIAAIKAHSSCFDKCYTPRMSKRGPACEKFNTSLKTAFTSKNSESADFESPAIRASGRSCRKESAKQSQATRDQCINKCPDAKSNQAKM